MATGAAGVFNLTGDYAIQQGATWELAVVVYTSAGVLRDLSAATITAKIRRKFSDAASLVDMTVTAVDLANGSFKLSLTAVQTAALTISSSAVNQDQREVSLGVWDCEVLEGGVVDRILQGSVSLSQEATK